MKGNLDINKIKDKIQSYKKELEQLPEKKSKKYFFNLPDRNPLRLIKSGNIIQILRVLIYGLFWLFSIIIILLMLVCSSIFLLNITKWIFDEELLTGTYIFGLLFFGFVLWISIISIFRYVNFTDDLGKKSIIISILITLLLCIGITSYSYKLYYSTEKKHLYNLYKTINIPYKSDFVIDIHPDNIQFAIGSSNGYLKICDINLSNYDSIYTGNSKINILKYSKDGNFIALGSEKYSIINSPKPHPNKLAKISFNENTFLVYDLAKKEMYAPIQKFESINALDFSSDGQILAVGVGSIIYLLSVTDFSLIDSIDTRFHNKSFLQKEHLGIEIYCLKFNPVGKSIAFFDRNLKIVELKSKIIKQFDTSLEDIKCIDFNKDGYKIVCGGETSIIIIDLNTEIISNFYYEFNLPLLFHSTFNFVKYLNNDKYIITLRDDLSKIQIFDTGINDVISLLKHENSKINSFGISSDENYIISSDNFGIIKVWKKL